MMKATLYLSIVLLLLTACQPTTPSGPPTDIPFPTVTVGQRVEGTLPTPGARTGISPNPLAGDGNQAALNVRSSPTPDTSRCPFPTNEAELGDFPQSRADATGSILQYLNDGGSIEQLQNAILTGWEAFGDTGQIDTVDLTGEGTVEIVITYVAPGDVGTLLIFGCQAGRYVQLYEVISDGIEPPAILAARDINNVPPNEMVITRRICTDPEACDLQTQIIGWEYTLGRFVNLLRDPVLTLDQPELRDIDNDLVDELVINLTSNGTTATGPLRQGTNIYDWNGQLYLLSIIQLQEPSYRIQVIHEGDRLFSQERMTEAINAYINALEDDELRYWFNDGPVNTISYGQYRLILAYAFLGDSGGIITALEAMNNTFQLEEGETFEDLPIYVQMANTFVETLSASGDLHEACVAVQAIIEADSSALGFINRYGSRSPTYTALDLCPY